MCYEMTPEFQQAVASIDHSNEPLLITGAAGTGKSVLIRQLIEHYDGDAVACAFTGLAASNLEGVTLHSLFRIAVTAGQHPMDQVGHRPVADPHRLDRWFRVVIIDEISMVNPALLDLIEAKLRRAFHPDLIFGGKKVVMVGDPFQLEPIGFSRTNLALRQRLEEEYGAQPNFRNAHCLHGVEVPEIQLTTNWRQAEDTRFYQALAAIRHSTELPQLREEIDWVNTHRPRNGPPPAGCLKIRHSNREVDRENETALQALEEAEDTSRLAVVGTDHGFIYEFLGGGREESNFDRPIDRPGSITDANLTDRGRSRLPSPPTLRLAFGARVVLSANQWNHGLVNGTLGRLQSIRMRDGTVYDRENLPRYPLNCDAIDSAAFLPDDADFSVRIQPYRWGRNRVDYDPETERYRLQQEGSYRQLPFRLGYATTVHKAQGMTLDCVDFSLPAPSWPNRRNLIYTALSRVRELQGLYLDRDLEVQDLV